MRCEFSAMSKHILLGSRRSDHFHAGPSVHGSVRLHRTNSNPLPPLSLSLSLSLLSSLFSPSHRLRGNGPGVHETFRRCDIHRYHWMRYEWTLGSARVHFKSSDKFSRPPDNGQTGLMHRRQGIAVGERLIKRENCTPPL